MKVERVTATIKYSQDTGKGAWKAVELGAEATIDANDSWQVSQHQLYGELSQQLHKLWANGKTAQNGSESAVQPISKPESPPAREQPEHFCQEHSVPFKRYARGESVWYAHKTGNTWCREGK